MDELKNNFQRAKNNYEPQHLSYVYDSIVEKNTPAQIFVNDLDNPSISLTWDKGQIFYFGSILNDETEYNKVVGFLKEEILSENIKKKLGVAKVYYPSARWEKVLLESLKEFNPSIRLRRIHKHDLQYIPTFPLSAKGIEIKEIDYEKMGKDRLGPSDGFGYCAIGDDNIVGWCKAGYISKNFCGIGIQIDEKYRRKGLASITSSKILEKCLQLKITPYWESWKSNIPSIRVAEKLGFRKLYDYKIVFLEF